MPQKPVGGLASETLTHVGGEAPKSVTPIVTVATSRLSSILGSGTLSQGISPSQCQVRGFTQTSGSGAAKPIPPGSDVPRIIDLLARTLLSDSIRPALATLVCYDAYPKRVSADNGFNVLSADCAWKW